MGLLICAVFVLFAILSDVQILDVVFFLNVQVLVTLQGCFVFVFAYGIVFFLIYFSINFITLSLHRGRVWCRPFQSLRCCLEAGRSRGGIENFGRVYKQTLHPCKEIQILKFYFFTLFYFLCFLFIICAYKTTIVLFLFFIFFQLFKRFLSFLLKLFFVFNTMW
jgi:hypothetical protein